MYCNKHGFAKYIINLLLILSRIRSRAIIWLGGIIIVINIEVVSLASSEKDSSGIARSENDWDISVYLFLMELPLSKTPTEVFSSPNDTPTTSLWCFFFLPTRHYSVWLYLRFPISRSTRNPHFTRKEFGKRDFEGGNTQNGEKNFSIFVCVEYKRFTSNLQYDVNVIVFMFQTVANVITFMVLRMFIHYHKYSKFFSILLQIIDLVWKKIECKVSLT